MSSPAGLLLCSSQRERASVLTIHRRIWNFSLCNLLWFSFLPFLFFFKQQNMIYLPHSPVPITSVEQRSRKGLHCKNPLGQGRAPCLPRQQANLCARGAVSWAVSMETNLFQWYVFFACPQMNGAFMKSKDRALRWKREERKLGKRRRYRARMETSLHSMPERPDQGCYWPEAATYIN